VIDSDPDSGSALVVVCTLCRLYISFLRWCIGFEQRSRYSSYKSTKQVSNKPVGGIYLL